MKRIDKNKFLFKELPFWLIIFLVVLIPFQAFLITWAREVLNLSGQGVFFISLWKEYILIILILLVFIGIFKSRKLPFRIILLDKIIFTFFALGFLYFLIFDGALVQGIAGLRYDMELFIFYFVSRSLVFDRQRIKQLVKCFLFSSFIVLLFGLLQVFILPPSSLEVFGYSSGLTEYGQIGILSTYRILNPTLAGIYRIQSFLPGALQFSSYLLFLFFILLGFFIYGKKNRVYLGPILFLSFLGLIFTFTRSAWIGLVVGFSMILYLCVKSKKAILFSFFSLLVTGYFFVRSMLDNEKFQAIVFHGTIRKEGLFGSTPEHLEAVKEGMVLILSNPFGLGLGVSGPASKYSENIIIPENWYLQIGTELGVLGLVIFVAILVVGGKYLFDILKKSEDSFYKSLGLGLLGALVAISVSSLFLHTWADTATVYPFWILFGLLVSQVDNSDIMKKERR